MDKKLIIHNGKIIYLFKIVGESRVWGSHGAKEIVEKLAIEAGYTIIYTGDGNSNHIPDIGNGSLIVARNPHPSGNGI